MTALHPVKPLTPKISGFSQPIYSYACDGNKVLVNRGYAEGSVETAPDGACPNCYGTYSPRGPLFLTESFTDRDAMAKIVRILDHGHHYYAKRFSAAERRGHVVSCQLDLLELEEREIRLHHLHLLKLNGPEVDLPSYFHLFLPTEPFYCKGISERLAEIAMSDLSAASTGISLEALAAYCFRFSLDIEKIIPTFAYSDTEEYELEKLLVDFYHEARSPILRALKIDILNITRKIRNIELGEEVRNTQKIIQLEIKLIRYREELRKHLEVQLAALHAIESSIEKIALRHQELENLYLTTILLKKLLEGWVCNADSPFDRWGQKLLLFHFLDEQLHVTPILSSVGMGRATMAFAIRYALQALSRFHRRSSLVEMAFQWVEACRVLNRCRIEKASQLPAEEIVQLAYKLREFTFKVLTAFPKKRARHRASAERVNIEFLSFLPPFIDRGKEIVPLVEYDKERASPLVLTPQGEKILEPILYGD